MKDRNKTEKKQLILKRYYYAMNFKDTEERHIGGFWGRKKVRIWFNCIIVPPKREVETFSFRVFSNDVNLTLGSIWKGFKVYILLSIQQILSTELLILYSIYSTYFNMLSFHICMILGKLLF